MTLSILLEDKFNQTGLCIPLLFGDPKLTDLTEIDGSEFQVYLKSKRNDELHHSAKKAGQLAFELLQNEGYVHRSIKIYLKIEADINHVRGSSADLLFAIAVMTAVLDKDYPSIAATGSLFKGKKWQVSGVEAVPHKLEAAFKTLPNGGIIFYPKENDSEINNTLRLQAEQQGIELYAVEWLNQVAERLDIETALFYSGECPYRGLEAFRAEHHNIYFGRQAEVETVIVKLKQREQAHTPGLLIISASGTGKSSFVQAGLIPALSRGQLALQDRRVFSAVWQPSDMGETVNESSLVQSLIANWQKQPELLAIKSNTIQTLKKLSPTLASALPANRRFVWVLNQMEELFTLNFSRDLLKTFCEFLQALQKIGVWVIATLRNDFYDRYQKQPALLTMFGSTGVYDLPALDVASLRQIIEEPARLADVCFEINDKQISLVDRLLEDMAGNTEALPLLEFILQELHQGRVDGVMSYQKYQQLNGLMGSIGFRAETVFSALNEQAQATLPRLLWKLAAKAKDDPRKQIVAQAIYLNEFAVNDSIRYLITAFIEQRLLIQDNENKQAVRVRVAHEALLTHWGRAKEIIDGFIGDRQLHDQLQEQARDWQIASNEQANDFLIAAGEPLIRAKGLLNRRGTELLPTEVSALIEASIVLREAELAEKERQRQELEHQFKHALVGKLISQSLLAIHQPSVANGYASHALLLAAQAFKLAPSNIAAQGNLLHILQHGIHINKYFYGHNDRIYRVAWSSDGKRVVSGCVNNIILWDMESAQVISQLCLKHKIKKSESYEILIPSIAFSPDGRRAVSSNHDNHKDNSLILWNLESGKVIDTWQGHQKSIRGVAFSPDGKQVVSSSYDSKLILWEVESGQAIKSWQLNHDTFHFSEVAFSPDGKQVIICLNHDLCVLDVESGQSIGQFKHDVYPDELLHRVVFAYSSDSKQVVSGSDDGTLMLWNVESGQAIGQPWQGGQAEICSVAFSPDGKRVVIGSDDGTLMLWNVESGQAIGQPWQGGQAEICSVAFSPDGKQVVSGSDDGTLILWNVDSQNTFSDQLWRGNEEFVTGVVFSQDGKSVLSSSSFDDVYTLWDVKNGKIINQRKHQNKNHRRVAFSSGGKLMLSFSGFDHILTLHDMESGKETEIVTPEDRHDIIAAALSADNNRIIICTLGPMILWDVKSAKMIGQPWEIEGVCNSSAAFSPDGQRVISGCLSHYLILWNVKNGKPLDIWKGHKDIVDCVAFSPDGKRVVSGSRDKSLILWDVESGNVSGQIWQWGHQTVIKSVAFSPDGKRVISGGEDGTLTLWDVDVLSWATRACDKANRNFTRAEWDQFIGEDLLPYQKTCEQFPLDE